VKPSGLSQATTLPIGSPGMLDSKLVGTTTTLTVFPGFPQSFDSNGENITSIDAIVTFFLIKLY
jgi:hypothetical protein